MKVLVINCGSSSLKYQLIDSETEEVMAKGLCERIGIDGRLTHKPASGGKYEYSDPLIPFDELPDDWVCPICGAPKSVFKKE